MVLESVWRNTGGPRVTIKWKMLAPLAVWLAIYLIPVPAGLNANQWHYFAVFAAVIAGLILESMPVGAVGLIGLTFAGVMGYVEHDPNKSLRWMLSGFSESTVWLIVGAFVFAIGYRKSGLGRRVAFVFVRGLGPPHHRPRLCSCARRPCAGPGHAFQYRAQRRHGVSDRQQHPPNLRLGARA